MSYRFMRTLLFFDLPSVTNEDKRNYRRFVKTLITNGYNRIQESVFCKMSIDIQTANTYINRLQNEVPKKGFIMALTVTEKQFSTMKILLGEEETDVVVSDDRTIDL